MIKCAIEVYRLILLSFLEVIGVVCVVPSVETSDSLMFFVLAHA